jgi:DNA-binding XRE family transcriptional regulator
MTFAQWVKTLRHGVLAEMGRVAGISYATLMRASAGEPVESHKLCVKMAELTGGAVSADAVSLGDPDAQAEAAARKLAWLERQAARAKASKRRAKKAPAAARVAR